MKAGPGVRWTVGDVSDRGFEALRLSIWGAWRLFGPGARYAVCVNSVPVERAREKAGPVPAAVAWRDNTGELPAFIRERLGPGMAEGVGWKFAPLRLFPDRHELALDNDCILWAPPAALRRWLEGEAEGRCLFSRDVRRLLGLFDDQCPPGAWNSGIRGLPPGFDLEAAFREVLRRADLRHGRPVRLEGEVDEQGLQAAAVSLDGPPLAVEVEDVSVCSPFWPHRAEPGRCGAHLVGLNARHIDWDYYGRPADEWMAEHWRRLRPLLAERTGAPGPGEE